ncbi:mRNA (2'-O-methyladenosine-N(6)-)-methyltransferase [Perkinsus chesapeaki]|uniref:mRNA (2'-O-methyladenosine-N(6)-)-methyltransferase n=1 Tax=Perkinsus chesapeaki TaxID=330153 RepID=A0A7J6LWI7_PERCH|nr:mRNA (2'-O-methyladenosine-N(6)-)-methyltransferase [Perkinsus chesapeaki]
MKAKFSRISVFVGIKYLYSKIPVSGPSVFPALIRILATAIFLFLAVFVSASIWTGSMQWMGNLTCMYRESEGTISSNPVFATWTASKPRSAVDGKRCRLWFQLDPRFPVSSTLYDQLGYYTARTGLLCGSFSSDIFGGMCDGGRCLTCIADRPCYGTVETRQIEDEEVVWVDNQFPAIPSGGTLANVLVFLDDQTVIQMSNTAVGLMPICSLDGQVTPGHSIVILGLFIGSVILVVLVAAREIREWFKVRKSNHEDTVDDAVMVAHIGEAVESMKRESETAARHYTDPHDDAAGRRADSASQRSIRSGSDRRASTSSQGAPEGSSDSLSSSWRLKLENMKIAAATREKVAIFRGIMGMVARIIIYFVVHMVAILLIFALSPSQFFPYSWWSLFDGFISAGTVSYWSFTDLLVMGDIFISIILLLPSICRPQWFSLGNGDATKTRRGEIRQNMMANSEACVVILVRSGTCANFTKRRRLMNLAQKCEDLFPASKSGQSKVFVVDYGNGATPKDDCCNMLRRTVSFNINYAYLPEDNPVVALHWTNKVWIPAVAKRHSLEKGEGSRRASYRYALVIDDIDGVNEYTLPTVFDSQCREHNEAGIQLVVLPPVAMEDPQTTKTAWMMDDFLIKLENIRGMALQSMTGSMITTPTKSICLWDRISLYEAAAEATGPQRVRWSSEMDQCLALKQLRQVECRTAVAGQSVTVTTNMDLFAVYCAAWALQGRLLWELLSFRCATITRFLAKWWILFDQFIPKFFTIMRPLMLVVVFLRSPFDTVFIILVYILLLVPASIFLVMSSLRYSTDLTRNWSKLRLLMILPGINMMREILYGYSSLYHAIFTYRPSYPSLDAMSKKAPNESFNAWLFAALAEPDWPLATEEKEHLFVEVSEEADTNRWCFAANYILTETKDGDHPEASRVSDVEGREAVLQYLIAVGFLPKVSPLCKYLERSHAEIADGSRNGDSSSSGVNVISIELERMLRQDFRRARKDILEKWPAVVGDFLDERHWAARVERTCQKKGRVKYSLVLPTEELPKELEDFVIRQPLGHEILEEYDERLRERYARGRLDPTSSIGVSERIWLLLHRYYTLFGTKSGEGRGWQLGTPTEAMELMTDRFRVSHECFASPLNATLSSFCSLFYDTDSFFGSVGSFFRLPLDDFPAACEIGPPYEPGLMLKAVLKVEKILARACKTFVFVVPDWDNCESIDSIKQSKYNIGSVSLDKEEHRYKNGFQHMVLKASLKHSMCETPTLIAWLSSSETVRVSEENKERMKSSWRPVN